MAIDATRGEVVMFGGKVIPAYFHSSSGGYTIAHSAFVFVIGGMLLATTALLESSVVTRREQAQAVHDSLPEDAARAERVAAQLDGHHTPVHLDPRQ